VNKLVQEIILISLCVCVSCVCVCPPACLIMSLTLSLSDCLPSSLSMCLPRCVYVFPLITFSMLQYTVILQAVGLNIHNMVTCNIYNQCTMSSNVCRNSEFTFGCLVYCLLLFVLSIAICIVYCYLYCLLLFELSIAI
jgi:hypothetical protein